MHFPLVLTNAFPSRSLCKAKLQAFQANFSINNKKICESRDEEISEKASTSGAECVSPSAKQAAQSTTEGSLLSYHEPFGQFWPETEATACARVYTTVTAGFHDSGGSTGAPLGRVTKGL